MRFEMAKSWQGVEASRGVDWILATFRRDLHLEKTGKESANMRTVAVGCWDDLLVIVLGQTNLRSQDNGCLGVWQWTGRHLQGCW